ncbi:MAG: holo-ACP synthase [Alphaproteobacteria bacterium]|nr:holo-ACP synthase [Alphaproteobacteria bacterium]
MILGIGNDLTDIRRVERNLTRHGERFVRRCFTEAEISYVETRPSNTQAASYAKRFAAKEACAKALGTGFRDGLTLRHIAICNDQNGRPECVLTGPALDRLKALTPAGRSASLHLSLSDEPPYAQAFVVIESL